MGIIQEANEILKTIALPKEVRLKFEDFDVKDFKVQTYLVKSEPYLISSDRSLKIYLRYPFYVNFENKAAMIVNEEAFNSLKLSSDFEVLSLNITDMQVLEVKCKNFKFLAFAGLSYGWGIYNNDQEIVQHYGYDEGIEF